MLDSLGLSEDERAFARTQACIIFDQMREAYVSSDGERLEQPRRVAAAAAVAYALVLANAWIEQTQKQLPPARCNPVPESASASPERVAHQKDGGEPNENEDEEQFPPAAGSR